MKLAALFLIAMGVAIVAAGSCSVSHLSDDFVCDAQHRCSSDRTCVDGYCVALGIPDAGIDGPGLVDASVCPIGCTTCNVAQKTCTINCATNNGACNQRLTCPLGWSCDIICSPNNSCSAGVVCTNARSCTVSCTGRGSCKGITCGTSACKVNCSGTSSCQDVFCAASCACDVTCGVNSQCQNLTCPTGCTSMSTFGGCSSLIQGCNTCVM